MANSTQPRIDNLYGLKDTGVDTQPKCGVPHVQRASGGSLFGKCPKCNAKTCPHYLYCKTCGYQLRENPKFCQCGNKVSSRDNYCDQCGRKT